MDHHRLYDDYTSNKGFDDEIDESNEDSSTSDISTYSNINKSKNNVEVKGPPTTGIEMSDMDGNNIVVFKHSNCSFLFNLLNLL